MEMSVGMQLDSVEGYEPGQQINWGEIFKVGDKVDVAGTTNGKGFQGEAVKALWRVHVQDQ
jgi:large subunit ribosomal protein L3